MRGKMRFWGKMKQGEKKVIRSLASNADIPGGDLADTGLFMGEGEQYRHTRADTHAQMWARAQTRADVCRHIYTQ